eukprot:CAMPEP_0115104802 /NCGR_PEP_ID=MMETSP0227-20121206/35555_1 /TAXON_ID=89957 /ORGANISM="Polarella glacialis, Strain CCMP 1383" /LENGTH=570 /DNA_ID=CAMNT_0002501835 /DNA_START=198 /DNA_END=1910 /DNA_ORIENTATION=-
MSDQEELERSSPSPSSPSSCRRVRFAAAGALLLAAVGGVALATRDSFSKPDVVSYARRTEGPDFEATEELWEEARARLKLAKLKLEAERVKAMEERRMLTGKVEADGNLGYAPERKLFDLFGLLGHQDATTTRLPTELEKEQMREAEKARTMELLKEEEKKEAEEAEGRRKRFEDMQEASKKRAADAEARFEHIMELKKADDDKKAAIEQAKEEAAASKKQRMELKQELLVKEKQAVVEEANLVKRVSLYCFALMMPFGYETGLLLEQKKRGVGIFECDEWAVYTNQSMQGNGEPFPFPVNVVPVSLYVPLGGRWHTALNRDVFNQIWLKVVQVDRYRRHDWIVKVDPDSVFFPNRLKEVIARRTPIWTVHDQGPEPDKLDCGYCKKEGYTDQTCAAHVHWMQSQGSNCRQALESVSRPAPVDCECACDDFACDLPSTQAMYLNNCQWGLHGPIEVFSRRAIATYIAGLPICADLLPHAWGEDKFVDQCMMKLGLTRVDVFDLLSEIACGEQPAPCGQTDVTFHPFKNVEKWFACWNFARKYGHGPEDRLAQIRMQEEQLQREMEKNHDQ